MYLSDIIRERIERKKRVLDALRPLPTEAVRKLQEQFALEMTYNSNAIEGNSLTLKETFFVLSEGITIKGKPLRDHLEARNHSEALTYLFDSVNAHKNQTLSPHFIRTLHQLVVSDTEKEWAGKYRNSAVMITGTEHKPPEAFEVSHLVDELFMWLTQEQKKLHIVELSALFHHKLVHIHPFFDGNGRTARLAMNMLLLKAGYPLAIIQKNDRKKYYRVLARADKSDYAPLVTFIAQAVDRSLNIYLNTLTPTGTSKEEYITLAELSVGTTYTAKYLNLLARTGKLDAHKEGRIWVASKEALSRYREGRERTRVN